MTARKPAKPPNQSAIIVLLVVTIFIFVCIIVFVLNPKQSNGIFSPTPVLTIETNRNLKVSVSILNTVCTDAERIDYSLVELIINGGTPPYDLTVTNSNLELSGPYLIPTNNFPVRIKIYGGDHFTASVRSKIGENWSSTIGLPFEAQYCKATPNTTSFPISTNTAIKTLRPQTTYIGFSTSTSTPKSINTANSTNTPKTAIIPSISATTTPNILIKYIQEKQKDSVFWLITATLIVIFSYVIGVSALIVRATKKGSAIFSSSWLAQLAVKPLLITPKLSQWALFIGYKKRLLNQTDVRKAANKYFGLPALGPDLQNIIPDETGDNIHNAIAKSLSFQRPVVITAKGGGGKTTLLARMSYLCLNNKISSLKGFTPILINPAYYTDSLLDSITSVLRERYRVGVDAEITKALLETGKFLILFDGVSEIEADKIKGLREILKTAFNENYRLSRFVIATRPDLNIPPETILYQLKPLDLAFVKKILRSLSQTKEENYNISRQLERFSSKPIEPLLFSMILSQGRQTRVSSTRSQLYKEYFKRLLRIDDEYTWAGWNDILKEIAKWFLLDTGSRGVGLNHKDLIDMLYGGKGDATNGNFIKNLNRYYRFDLKDELAVVQKLDSSGIIKLNRRWNFSHDTFEEYFAASYIFSSLTHDQKIPNLSLWMVNNTQINSFIGVIEFVKEMANETASDEALKLLAASNLPNTWKKVLEL